MNRVKNPIPIAAQYVAEQMSLTPSWNFGTVPGAMAIIVIVVTISVTIRILNKNKGASVDAPNFCYIGMLMEKRTPVGVFCT